MQYVIGDWYWFVGGDQTRAYSSKVADYVPVADPAYIAFTDAGGYTTVIDTEFNLGVVLGPLPFEQQPTPPGINEGYLAYKEDQNALWVNHEDRLRNVEVQLGILSPPLPQSIAPLMAARKPATPVATVTGLEKFEGKAP